MRKSKIYEVVWSKTERTHLFNGILLSPEDNIRLRHAICIFVLIIVDTLDKYNIVYNWHDITHLIRNIPADVVDLKDNLDECIEMVRSPRCHPVSTKWWIKPLTVLCHECDNSWRGICIRRDLNTIFSHIGHLTLVDIESGCSEESIATLTAPYKGEGDLNRLRSILSEYQFDKTLFAPEFSSGATTECVRGSGPAARWYCPMFPRTKYVFAHTDPRFIEYFTASNEKPISELVAVPKSMTKKRPITIEPSLQTFVQQGLRHMLEAAISNHNDGIEIFLHDQSYNQKLALQGSYDEYWATIDLSKASDSIKVAHVMCFPKEIARLLLAARTPYVLSNDQAYYMETYAGMGNATTFRVECIIFAAIARMACEDAGITVSGSVYGDDIIVPTTAADHLYRLLSQFGFKVNEEKSYSSGYFRESCGIEAFMGNDISPVRIPRRFMMQSVVPIDCIRDYANALIGYPLARRYVLRTFLKNRKLYSTYTDERYLLSSGTNLNSNLNWRYNKNLQRYEYRVHQPITRTEPSNGDGAYYYRLLELERTKRKQLLYPDDRIDTRLGRSRLSGEAQQWVAI